jgi:thiosulfate dehydrogenase
VKCLALLLVVGGCTESAQDYGRDLFSATSLSTADSNPFSCTTCHEITPQDTKVNSGYTMWNATRRPSWWGGFELTFLDSINQCVTNFMRGKELAPTDEKARALKVYLDTLGDTADAPALPLTIVKDIVDVPSGDAANGKKIWDQTCGNCHGAPHTGAGRVSSVASLVPDDSLASFGTDPKKGARPVTIEKTRHGKFFAIGGNMAPFSVESLSDMQLGDVLAYLEMFGLPKSP